MFLEVLSGSGFIQDLKFFLPRGSESPSLEGVEEDRGWGEIISLFGKEGLREILIDCHLSDCLLSFLLSRWSPLSEKED
jgi:hypothetical protein